MIRRAAEADVPAMLEIYAPYVKNTTYTFEYEVPSEEEFSERLAAVTRQFPWLVWEEEGRVLGYAYGSAPFDRAAYDWCAEVSIYLAPELQGRGAAQKLYALLEEILFRQGYRVIYSLVTSENRRSLAFHKKMGYRVRADFQDCGIKFGRWLGVVWLEKRSKTVEMPIYAPISWLSIIESDEILGGILDKLSIS